MLLRLFQSQLTEIMLIKILLKIWPGLSPLIAYIFWNFVVKKLVDSKKSAKNDLKVVGAKSTEQSTKSWFDNQKQQKKFKKKILVFSLKNRTFVMVLYLSFNPNNA